MTPEQFEEQCRIDRLRAIRDVAAALATLETMGENDMGNLTYREATSFHAITRRLRALVDRLTAEEPAP